MSLGAAGCGEDCGTRCGRLVVDVLGDYECSLYGLLARDRRSGLAIRAKQCGDDANARADSILATRRSKP